MCRSTIIIAASLLCALNLTQTQASPDDVSRGPTITVIELDMDDKVLKLCYKINNRSGHDIWICEDIDLGNRAFEAFLAEDGQTLLIRRRLDVPLNVFREQPIGRYVRLRMGRSRTESLLLPLPVHLRPVFTSGARTQGTVHVSRLVLNIGFYAEDLPGMVRRILEAAENIKDANSTDNSAAVEEWIGDVLHFTTTNEHLRARDEKVQIPWSDQTLRGERVLEATVDGLHVPYSSETQEGRAPNLSDCTRLEIQYQPSMLEYCFPYAGEQGLLNTAEKQNLRSQRTIVVDDREQLEAFAQDVSEAIDEGIITEGRTAYVVCYHDDERLTSFTVYDDTAIETEEKQRFWYSHGLKLTPQTLQPFELRVRCAGNLKNLWHRLRLYHIAQKAPTSLKEAWELKRNQGIRKAYPRDSSGKSEMVYPVSGEWCDALLRGYRVAGGGDSVVVRQHMCPSAGEGKCHYAMNLNCEPDSPPDTVLLFETRAGWNQHGGAELFTFDNHDPNGGCVLFNDGTVKFIRTDEELRQLRWK
ncbi:MAG: hypothetical protein ACYTE3_28290 [Planctomycetota bacterium]|jgi:hypothetical protein